jgi:hypothetical protein
VIHRAWDASTGARSRSACADACQIRGKWGQLSPGTQRLSRVIPKSGRIATINAELPLPRPSTSLGRCPLALSLDSLG